MYKTADSAGRESWTPLVPYRQQIAFYLWESSFPALSVCFHFKVDLSGDGLTETCTFSSSSGGDLSCAPYCEMLFVWLCSINKPYLVALK